MTVWRKIRSALAPALLVLLPGCLSTTLYETARVCPPKAAEMTVAATPWFWRWEPDRFVFEQWNTPGPELSVRAGLFRNFGAGLRLVAAPGCCLTTKYQFLRAPVDVAATAAAYGYVFAAIDAGSRFAGAYGGLIASNERDRSVPFSLQALLRYERKNVSGFRLGYKTDILTAAVGAGIPVDIPVSGGRALRVHPAASVNLPLSWRYWDWEPSGIEPDEPPEQADDWRGVVTFDLGIALSYITQR
jgi:hypothetical protein